MKRKKEHEVPNAYSINMTDLPKGEYSGPWCPGPLKSLAVTDNGDSNVAEALSSSGLASLEIRFHRGAIAVIQEKPA